MYNEFDEVKYEKKGLFRRKHKTDTRKLDYDITREDILAMIIAAFQVFIPIFLSVIAILTIMVLFVTKVWLR